MCIIYFNNIYYIYIRKNNIKIDLWDPISGRSNNGVFLNFSLTTKFIFIDEPQNYSPATAKEIVSESNLSKISNSIDLDNPLKRKVVVNNNEIPKNIIVIMNESLADLSILGNFETNEDYMPFIHSLTENTIKGNTYVSRFGGGTANSEYEFLSGNSMAFAPTDTIIYQRYLRDEMSSLANILKTHHNFYTFASHTFFKSGWNRPEAYEYLKFDETRFIED